MSLETFAPIPRRVTVAGRPIAITPLRMRQLPGFAAGVRPLMPYLLKDNLMEAMAANAGGLTDAVVVATGIERDWIEDLYPDDFAVLAGAVLEVNADFFARRVLPATRAAATTLTKAIRLALGASASPGSPGADTASPTSST